MIDGNTSSRYSETPLIQYDCANWQLPLELSVWGGCAA
ncbi:hypothetical protein CPter91_1856 [Collimonas pratensis]|uniref:Uncharacterized protein n=1 Tax=Collimonas pratensis TaxID=279113 RepID=A0A127Q2F4_9BURK|nr:hypothetical protein CPter91_1856 [Collimonas pratensis]